MGNLKLGNFFGFIKQFSLFWLSFCPVLALHNIFCFWNGGGSLCIAEPLKVLMWADCYAPRIPRALLWADPRGNDAACFEPPGTDIGGLLWATDPWGTDIGSSLWATGSLRFLCWWLTMSHGSPRFWLGQLAMSHGPLWPKHYTAILIFCFKGTVLLDIPSFFVWPKHYPAPSKHTTASPLQKIFLDTINNVLAAI